MSKPIRLYDWRNGFSPTYGIGGLGAVYDTLRKRSYRKWKRAQEHEQHLVDVILNSNDPAEVMAAVGQLDANAYDEDLHHAYVDGVRDALQAVAERLSE